MNDYPAKFEIRAFRNPSQAFAVELYAFNRTDQHVAQTLVMKEHVSGMRMDPFISLNDIEAQMLMDSLYDAGLRPSQSSVKKDEEAVKAHLEDMRRIAFGFIGGINHGRYAYPKKASQD
jgi:hypothetical protein